MVENFFPIYTLCVSGIVHAEGTRTRLKSHPRYAGGSFFYSINVEERSFSSFSIFNCRRIPIFVSLFVSNLHRYIGSTMYNNNSGNNDNNNIDLQFMLHGMEYKLLIITGKEYLLTEAAVSYT